MKIKNENDMLGFLIKHMDSRKDVPASVILKESGLDQVSCNRLLKDMAKSGYIIFSMDVMTVTSLGENNYVSPKKKFFLKVREVSVIALKEIIVFFSGVGVGLAVNFLTSHFGW